MKNSPTLSQINDFITIHGRARVPDLIRELGISRQMLHRHLSKLIERGVISKSGKPPLVFYEPATVASAVLRDSGVSIENIEFIDNHYLWVSPTGQLLYGYLGFCGWAETIKMSQRLSSLADEYVKTVKEAESYRNSLGLIDATKRLKSVFTEVYLDKLFYMDFYSLPKFGKTRLGQLVLHAKQGQQVKLINQISLEAKKYVRDICKTYKVDAVGMIPPTLPRKIQFTKELERALALQLPKLILVKAYKGDVPVAQKTLNKLEDRVTNARSSIFMKDHDTFYKTVLLIDDAVGSGASFNEVAKKLKTQKTAQKVIGLAIVGSYKGFDVISEI